MGAPTPTSQRRAQRPNTAHLTEVFSPHQAQVSNVQKGPPAPQLAAPPPGVTEGKEPVPSLVLVQIQRRELQTVA